MNRNKKIIPDEEIKIIKKKQDKVEYNINLDKLTDLIDYNKKSTELNDSIFELFPNIELAIEIMVSSIISPNTMIGGDYSISLRNDILPLDVVSTILDSIKSHVDNNYKFKDRLYNIVKDTVYIKGSYCELILPPQLLVDIYKDVEKKKNKLSAGIEDALSSYITYRPTDIFDYRKIDNKGSIVISENYDFFIKDKIINNYLNKNINYSIDAGTEDFQIVDQILSLDDSLEIENDYSLAFTKILPPESVIPISDKDDPSKHYGYFVIFNNVGTPIKGPSDFTPPTNNNIISFGLAEENKKISEGEKLLNKAKSSLTDITNKAPDLPNKDKIVEELLINKIRKALANSKLKDLVNYDLELQQSLHEVIYKKIKSSEKINIVFVPNKYLMYHAINYRENGTGKSLLEKIRLLSSIRAMLLMTRISAYIRSAIVTTDIHIELDETIPDPERTVAKVLNYVKKSRQMQLPIGMLKVNDFVDWLHNVGFKVTAEHPKLPHFELNVDESNLAVNIPDDSLEELIDKYQLLTIGVTPEMVDNSYSPDFATTIVANNVLMIRRISILQKKINPLLTENVKKYIENDPILYNKINSIIESNIKAIKRKVINKTMNPEIKDKLSKLKDDAFITWAFKELLKNLTVTLPTPELQEDDPNAELFDKLSQKLDTVLDVILSSDMFSSDLLGELGDQVDNQKNILKGLILFKWMSENRFLPEVAEIFTINEDGKPIFNLAEEYKTLVEALKANILPLLKTMSKFKKKSDEQLDKIENEDNDEDNEETTEDNENTEETSEESNTEESEESTEESEENSEESEEGEESEEEDLTKGLF